MFQLVAQFLCLFDGGKQVKNTNNRILSAATVLILILTATTLPAAPPNKDVNVVNTPDVVIANDNPIPVTVENSGGSAVDYVSVTEFEFVENAGSRASIEVFHVPAGKILIAEYVSILLDVVVRGRPTSGLKLGARLDGNGTLGVVRYELGYMEEFEFTSRGTPNFNTARELTAYYTEGPVNCVSDAHFGGVNLDFGSVTCSLSGRLIDAP